MATPSNCGNILLNRCYRLFAERGVWHHRETCGYGKNATGRDNPQPSPKEICKDFYGCSSETQCRWAFIRRHKIESAPSERSVLERNLIVCYWQWEESSRRSMFCGLDKRLPTPTKQHILCCLFYLISYTQ